MYGSKPVTQTYFLNNCRLKKKIKKKEKDSWLSVLDRGDLNLSGGQTTETSPVVCMKQQLQRSPVMQADVNCEPHDKFVCRAYQLFHNKPAQIGTVHSQRQTTITHHLLLVATISNHFVGLAETQTTCETTAVGRCLPRVAMDDIRNVQQWCTSTCPPWLLDIVRGVSIINN